MSLENEGQHLPDQPTESDDIQSQKNVRISYTRDFLLSLGELDACKKLPSGLDPSILREFEDTSQDPLRSSGSFPLHSFRRTEYGSSLHTRGETNSYSRSIPGRWDSRSSGKSDRDNDSQSDRDSESGKRFSNQSRHPWHGPEHDGLLGSGSFPYAAGAAAPKFRANDHYQLNKSNEPFHPPRPYKAAPFSRRDNNDAFNDETFGSSELTSEDRAEDEKKRRASFELMRKERQKEFQEKQKLNPNKPKDEFDITTLSDDPKDDKGHMSKKNEPDELVKLAASNSVSDKHSFTSQTLVSRPLVPPGFASSMSEKNIANKSLPHSHSLEVHDFGFEGGLQSDKSTCLSNGTSHNQEEKQSLKPINLNEQQLESENNIVSSSAVDISNKKISVDGELFASSEGSECSSRMGIDAEEITRSTDVHNSNINRSILDQLLGGALALNVGGSAVFTEQNDGEADDNLSPGTFRSSKFAQWFFEEEKRPVDDLSSSRPNDLLSLIVSGEKDGSRVLDVKSTENITSKLPFHISEIASTHTTSTLKSPDTENSEHLYPINKPEAVPAVLTCEDLEQSILSEVTENDSTLPPPVQSSNVPSAKTERQKSNIDDHASQHLLSLLQKSTGLKDTAPSPTLDSKSSEELQNIEAASLGSALGNLKEANSGSVLHSTKPLTLETLFGTAFMNELQSVGAPISVQTGSVGSARVDVSEDQGLPFTGLDEGNLSSTTEVGSNIMIHESVLASNQRRKMESDIVEEHLVGFDPRNEQDTSQLRTEIRSKVGGFDRSVDIRLPEEDSLITVRDPMHLQNFIPARSTAKTELLSAQETPIGIAEKLAALHSAFRDERSIAVAGGQQGQPFLRGSYDIREHDIPYHNPHVHPSSQFHTPQLNSVGPLFHPPEHPANNNSQMKFMGPDGVIRCDPPANYQFPANVLHPSIHHTSSGLTGFDPTSHHPMLQQMNVPGNFPPPQLRGFARGAAVPPRLNNQAAGFTQEHNPVPGFPFGNRPSNYGGIGIPPPGSPDVGGSNHPEVLQRLIGMQLRSNSKQIHPFAATARNQGMYSHELDFGYR